MTKAIDGILEEIKLDCREPEEIKTIFRQAFYSDYRQEKRPLKVSVDQLDVGDVQYDGVVIERKEIQDFIASMCDGRLFAQAEQMTKFPKKFLIIVGELSDYKGKVKPTQYLGAMASVMARYGISFAFVRNNEEFLYLTIKILQKATDGKSLHKVYIEKPSEPPSLKAVVSAIPLVGPERAEKIVEIYPTALRLCQATEEELQEVVGIGDVVSKNIKEVFK
jgi:ERCC4-type nuclease